MNEHVYRADIARILARMKDHVTHMVGEENAAGFQIAGLIRILANQYENIITHREGDEGLSGPRMGLLVRMLEEERHGNVEGITPTELSHNQNVSRNTISALLRGLEEQNLIERRLDNTDRRLFRIRLTQAGREAVTILAPQRIAAVSTLVSGLTPDEQQQLITLLSKLFESLQTNAGCPACKTGEAVEEDPNAFHKPENN